ncbi:MAG: outer membrane beta-barrel protein [Gemmatimonadaceae bacterium]
MKYGKLVMVALTALTVSAVPAQAQFPHLSVMGGVTMPKGDASTADNMGYNGGIALGFSAPMVPIGIRIDAAVHHFPGKDNNAGAGFTASTNIWSGTVNATYSLPVPAPVKPYAIAGLGYYGAVVTVDNVPGSASDKKLGYNAGVGIAFSRLFAEVRYHHMNTDGSALTFMPLTFGITF